MSTWTHIAATIRFDALRLPGMPDQTPDLGKTVQFEDREEAWDACTTPCGSEGSVHTHLWTNPEKHNLAAFTAMIWGDLRDYESVEEVIEYLERITKGRMVRQGVAEISVEGSAPVIVRYNDKTWVQVSPQAAA